MTLQGISKFLKNGGILCSCSNKKGTLFTLHNSSGLYISPIFRRDFDILQNTVDLRLYEMKDTEDGNHFAFYCLPEFLENPELPFPNKIC